MLGFPVAILSHQRVVALVLSDALKESDLSLQGGPVHLNTKTYLKAWNTKTTHKKKQIY